MESVPVQPLQNLSFTDFANMQYLLPELTLIVLTLMLVIIDLAMPKAVSRIWIGALSIAGLVTAGIFVTLNLGLEVPISFIGNSYRLDNFAGLLKLVFLGSTALILLMSLGSIRKQEIPHVGEYYYLFLPATVGAMILTSSGDLITLFVGLELLSITSFIMVGMRKSSARAAEGAFKYVVLGGISSALLLYGMSFLYGITGTTNLALMRQSIMDSTGSFNAMIYLSFFLMLVGIGFKIAAAPFHNWAADVYQAASPPVAAFLAVVSKGAGFVLLIRILYSVFYGLGDESMPIHNDLFLALTVLAAAAMIIGNTIALRQNNIKRLLAFSGVANAGYLLVPISMQFNMVHFGVFPEFLYYLIAYAFMNIGAFAIVMAVSRNEDGPDNEQVSAFAGLYYRAPYTAVAMIIFVLSFAGLPLTGGFLGKLYILLGTMQSQLYWLGGVMIVTSVISYFYYFGIIRQMFMRSSNDVPIKVPVPLGITIWLCTIITVVLGCFPSLVLDYVKTIFSISRDLIIQ